MNQIATKLSIDKPTTSRRLKETVGKGYLVKNHRTITLRDPLPGDKSFLPDPDLILAQWNKMIRDKRKNQ